MSDRSCLDVADESNRNTVCVTELHSYSGSAKSRDSFNDTLPIQHHYLADHVLFLAWALHRDQELWHTIC